MDAHYAIVTESADEACLLAVVRAHMLMVPHARSEAQALTQGDPIQQAIDVNPFAAVLAPRGTTECLAHSGGEQSLFQRRQMFTEHEVLG